MQKMFTYSIIYLCNHLKDGPERGLNGIRGTYKT